MGKGKCKYQLEIYSNNVTWEVGEQGSFLDFNIKVYIHYSTAQTRGLLQRNTCSHDPTSDPHNIKNYELASPSEAERPGGLSGVAR